MNIQKYSHLARDIYKEDFARVYLDDLDHNVMENWEEEIGRFIDLVGTVIEAVKDITFETDSEELECLEDLKSFHDLDPDVFCDWSISDAELWINSAALSISIILESKEVWKNKEVFSTIDGAYNEFCTVPLSPIEFIRKKAIEDFIEAVEKESQPKVKEA